MRNEYIHIASFAGNIGDLINHQGFYSSFELEEKNIKKIEMRRFYRNCREGKLEFDENLTDEINRAKALIVGGGGFFDVYWNESNTGTTLNMSKKFIDSIRVPVIVNAMGFHVDRTKTEAIKKFYKFFCYIKEKPNWYISIRNDGSGKRLQELYGCGILDGLNIVPDNGFMIKNKVKCSGVPIDKTIGFNLTNELIDLKYTNGISAEYFNSEISKLILNFLKKDYCCIFFLHTPQDITTLIKIMNQIGAEKFRNNIVIAPYLPFDISGGLEDFLYYYSKCKLVIGMRFHANVACIASNIPVIGLSIHEQISDMYDEIELSEYCVRVGEYDWIAKLRRKISFIAENQENERNAQCHVMDNIIADYDKYKKNVLKFVKYNCI